MVSTFFGNEVTSIVYLYQTKISASKRMWLVSSVDKLCWYCCTGEMGKTVLFNVLAFKHILVCVSNNFVVVPWNSCKISNFAFSNNAISIFHLWITGCRSDWSMMLVIWSQRRGDGTIGKAKGSMSCDSCFKFEKSHSYAWLELKTLWKEPCVYFPHAPLGA